MEKQRDERLLQTSILIVFCSVVGDDQCLRLFNVTVYSENAYSFFREDITKIASKLLVSETQCFLFPVPFRHDPQEKPEDTCHKDAGSG